MESSGIVNLGVASEYNSIQTSSLYTTCLEAYHNILFFNTFIINHMQIVIEQSVNNNPRRDQSGESLRKCFKIRI